MVVVHQCSRHDGVCAECSALRILDVHICVGRICTVLPSATYALRSLEIGSIRGTVSASNETDDTGGRTGREDQEMTTRARNSQSVEAISCGSGIVDEGAERYIWIFSEENQLVLAIPGLRGLKFSIHEARTIGEMLIQAADEMVDDQQTLVEGGDTHGSAEEHPAEG